MATDKVIKALGRKFTFTIANASANRYVLAITPAHFDTIKLTEGAPNTITYTDPTEIVAAGYACDAVVDDGTVLTNVTATAANSKMNIRNFLNYIKHYDLKVVDMSVRASNEDCFNENMEVINCSPLTGSSPQYLNLDDFRGLEQQTQTKAIVRDLGLQIEPSTLILLPVAAGRTISVTMYF